MSNEQWEQVYARLAELVRAHRTTLVFVNTRRMAERAARHLGERLGKDAVAAHHGSLAKETAPRRRAAPQARRAEGAGRDRVAGAGHRHRRRRPGLPARLAALDRRLPAARRPLRPCRRRHAEGAAVPAVARRAGRMRGAARLRAPRRARRAAHACPRRSTCWRSRSSPRSPAANGTRTRCSTLVRRAWPYAQLTREDFDAVVRMLADGFTTRRGPRAGYVHRDAVHQRLRERKGARLTALTSGGTIPDTGDYAVVLEPQAHQDRHRQRGLRGREPGRRRLPARQHQLPHPARRARPRARRGCAGRAADHPVLARRSAGAQRRAVVRRLAAARRGRRSCDRQPAAASDALRLAAPSTSAWTTKRRAPDRRLPRRARRPRSARCRRSSAS